MEFKAQESIDKLLADNDLKYKDSQLLVESKYEQQCLLSNNYYYYCRDSYFKRKSNKRKVAEDNE